MKTMFNPATIFFLVFFLQSCNLLSAAGISSHGQPTKKVQSEFTSTTANSSVNVDHSQWDKLLKKHVTREGMVDYKGFKRDEAELDGYLRMLSEKRPTNTWSVQELLAYYINLYNAATVKLILENYPVKSIKDIDGAWTKGRVAVGDKMLSLGGIENGILRKMNEPRIHFAINCASISCPNLFNEAFTANKINAQLDAVTRAFINSSKNEIGKNHLNLSKIFKWYKKDFMVNGKKDVIAFVSAYVNQPITISPNATIAYFEYDWGLNEQP